MSDESSDIDHKVTIDLAEYQNLKYQVHQCVYQLDKQRQQMKDYYFLREENQKLKNQVALLNARFENELGIRTNPNVVSENDEPQGNQTMIAPQVEQKETSESMISDSDNSVETFREERDQNELIDHILDLTLKLANSNAERDEKDLKLHKLQLECDMLRMQECLKAVSGQHGLMMPNSFESPKKPSPAQSRKDGATSKKKEKSRKDTIELMMRTNNLVTSYRSVDSFVARSG